MSSKPDTPPPDWPARRERARAFIRQELKQGQGWATKRYEYQEGNDDEAQALHTEKHDGTGRTVDTQPYAPRGRRPGI